MPKTVITPEVKKFIRENRLKMPSSQIAKVFGCSKSPIQRYMRENGLTPPEHIIKEFRSNALKGRTTCTPQQDKIIKEEYLNIPQKRLAKILGISATKLRIRIRQLGLVIPKELIEQRKNDSRFQPGHTPMNKGLSWAEYMPESAIEKAKQSWFKKGHLPHNTKYDGHISVRADSSTGTPYLYIRISKGNYQLLQRAVYEHEIGPIPKDHLITFKDGDSLNCRPENLECISMAENGRRTMNAYHNQLPEIKTAIGYRNKIQKLIKKQS